ncbi:MAG: M20/M25/M40 family metallo-hydrolase [Verrucomicrobia bacterium]|nr:M20/M25/M40 family metallo-hydrolase [Verrucomicrobiota bacterium]
MNSRRLRQIFVELLHVNSPSRREKPVAAYVKRAMRPVADEWFEDRAGKAIGGNANNLVFRLRGSRADAPPLVVVAHMDTVEPTPHLRIERRGTVVRSDGTTVLGADDKAGIAVMIEAARILARRRKTFRTVEFVFSVAEEVGLLGVEHLDYGRIEGRLGLVLDSNTPVGSIVVSAPSSDHLDVRIKGRKAHAGIEPEKGINAITVAARAIARLRQGRLDEEMTANIGVIEGGTATNIVPDEALVRGEARSFSERKLGRWVTHARTTFLKTAEAAGAEAQVETTRAFTTYDVPKTHPLVRAAARAARAIGRRSMLLRSGGGSDANVLNGRGITSVVLGLGYRDPHTKQESMDLVELDAAARWLLEIVETLGR